MWWIRVMVNLAIKLYPGQAAPNFWKDYQIHTRNILHWRGSLRGRGWLVPDSEQERLIGLLVTRCQKYLDAKGDATFIPGYIQKSLTRYVDELADELNHKFKLVSTRAMLSPQAREKLDEVIVGTVITALRERWKNEEVKS